MLSLYSLKELNTRKFKKLDTNRKELFLTLDKPALKPLPKRPYEFAEWKKARINIDYHIEIYQHWTKFTLLHCPVFVEMLRELYNFTKKGCVV